MWKNKLTVGCATVTMLLAGQGMADKVVVIPMGGGVGNAVSGDVLKGKTFSNAAEDGITGTRPPGILAKTGQTISTVATGEDGDYQNGEVWPSSRFWTGAIFIGAGRIDYLTGLIWDSTPNTSLRNWSEALTHCNGRVTGLPGLFSFNDWRLPNVKEMLSLIDYGHASPALPSSHPYQNIVADGQYWTSSHWMRAGEFEAWYVDMDSGNAAGDFKGNDKLAWCVRGGPN